ncbi:MAG: MFS transporter [Elusimicrobiota bacterium]
MSRTDRERRLLLFFAVCYFAEGMAGLAYEPVDYLLKDVLHLGPAAAALFITWMTLPLTIKPVFGLLTDMLPWAGRRRKPHMIAFSLISIVGWGLLAFLKGYRYGPSLAILTLINVGFVLSAIVCGGVMVERGKEEGKTGLYQAVQIGTLYATLILTGLGGGWLVAHASYKSIFLLAALFPIMAAASAVLIDEPAVGNVPETAARGWAGMNVFIRDPRAWAIAAAIFLWDFCPFLGTAQFYYQSVALKLSPVFIGGLSTAGGFAGVAGAALFGKLSAGPGGTPRLARWSVSVGGALTLLYVFYVGAWSTMLLTILFSLTGVIFRLAWMDLAARACPEGAEATAFAAFMAVFNIAAAASNGIGGACYEKLTGAYGAYAAMVILSGIGTACTFACWPLLSCAVPKPELTPE